MDGRRWALCVAGGLLGGLAGCSTLRNGTTGQTAATPSPTQVAKVMPPAPPPAAPRTSLSASTYVTMGALKEQAAEDTGRPAQEAEAFRHQARLSYQKALGVDPKYVQAYVALAKSYSATGERDKAQAMFQKAVALAPNNAALWHEMGNAQARAKDWAAAAESYAKAVKLDPDDKQAQKLLGFTLTRSGKYDDGFAALTKVMPEAEARTNLAKMMRHNQQAEAASAQVRLALQADPNYGPAKELLADLNTGGDSGVRTVGYTTPTPPAGWPAGQQPRALPPVMLGGTDGLTPPPAPINVRIEGITD